MNDHEEDVRAFVRDIPFDAPTGVHRDALKRELLNAFPRHRLQPTARPVGKWRTIMKSRKSQMAAAAAIVLTACLAMTFFDTTSGVAWADVAQRLEDIKTVTYRITADIKGMPGVPRDYVTHVEQGVQLSYEQGAVRIDSSLETPRGLRKTHTYILFEDSVAYTVMPTQKKYLKVVIGPDQMKQMEEEKGDPVTILKAMLEHDYTELGRKARIESGTLIVG